MASAEPIVLSDDEDGPSSPPPPARASPQLVADSPVRESQGEAGDTSLGGPEDSYAAIEGDDIYNVSLHDSDLEAEQGDIFAENLQKFNDLQRQAEEKLDAQPPPAVPDSPATAAKRPANEPGGGGKRRKVGDADREKDDEDELLERLLASPVPTLSSAVAVTPSPTTRRTRSGRVTRRQLATQAEDKQPVMVSDSPLPPLEESLAESEEPVIPEEEPTFTARVQAGTLIIRLQMKRTDRLQRLFDAVADELSLPVNRVCLGQRDVIYSPNQTPDDVQLGMFDMIEFWEGTSSVAAAAADTTAAEEAEVIDPDSIELRVQNAERRGAVVLRLKRSEPMSVLMERYARKKDVDADKLRFRFDGEALDPKDTPETLDLEGGECIDVHFC